MSITVYYLAATLTNADVNPGDIVASRMVDGTVQTLIIEQIEITKKRSFGMEIESVRWYVSNVNSNDEGDVVKNNVELVKHRQNPRFWKDITVNKREIEVYRIL